MSRSALATVRRLGVRATGAVQGVGFRPFAHRLARELGLSGFVRNDGEGVWIEVEGDHADAFVERLMADLPPLARLDACAVSALNPTGAPGFVVEESTSGPVFGARVPPDAGLCDRCLAELFDPNDRRAHYPFIACCDCGPRFTMTAQLPYDRPQTAMAKFPLCAPCAAEYADAGSRRFHAEPTCCAACGPRYDHDFDTVWAAIAAGEIVALQGVGGYHLICNARDPAAVGRLRARKERSAKPFALMAANAASLGAFAKVGPAEAALLTSPARPIVLAEAVAAPEGAAPGLDTLGLMLPATPAHWLLFWRAAGRPIGSAWTHEAQDALLVVTSANPGGEPLVTDRAEAHTRLAGIADLVVSHDRKVLVRADDPVARVIDGAPVYLRRGRGCVPEPILLPREVPSTVAFGAHLKAAVCVTRGREAFLAQHVGDLDDPATRRFHAETVAHLVAILDVKPERAACDLHPDFASTRAAEASGLRLVRVQHHHAHALACAAEHGLEGAFLALVLDGYGFGPNGEAWGGELLRVDGPRFARLGGLAPLAAPGGDRAAREPWRMAAAALHTLGRGSEIAQRFPDEPQAVAVAALLARGAPETTSCGRLFDAAAGLLGVSARQTYEGEAAMQLEALAGGARAAPVAPHRGGLIFDPSPLLATLIDAAPSDGAALFHEGLAAGLAGAAICAADATGLRQVALSGGCLANRRLAEGLASRLRAVGLQPLLHRAAPPGDGGLALGQALAAGLTELPSCA